MLTGKRFSILIIPKKILTDVRTRMGTNRTGHSERPGTMLDRSTDLECLNQSYFIQKQINQNEKSKNNILYYLMLIYFYLKNAQFLIINFDRF